MHPRRRVVFGGGAIAWPLPTVTPTRTLPLPSQLGRFSALAATTPLATTPSRAPPVPAPAPSVPLAKPPPPVRAASASPTTTTTKRRKYRTPIRAAAKAILAKANAGRGSAVRPLVPAPAPARPPKQHQQPPKKPTSPTRKPKPATRRHSGGDACQRVTASLQDAFASAALVYFTVRLKNGTDQLYVTHAAKVADDDGSGGVVLRMGVPTRPSGRGYPSGRAAQCLELSFRGKDGCHLEYLQTRAKYFLPGHLDNPLSGVPLTKCTQPLMDEGAAPWGRVWLEMARQLCLRLGLRYLDLQDESSVNTPSGQIVSLARAKLLTEGQTWYEREMHAVPIHVRAVYEADKKRLAKATLADVKIPVVRELLASIAALVDKARLPPSAPIQGPKGVAVLVLAAMNTRSDAVLELLGRELDLTDPEYCEHGSVKTAFSTFLGYVFEALGVQDPYSLLWRADLASDKPIADGVVLHGYKPLPPTLKNARDLLVT